MGSAWVKKPKGSPWAKYSEPSTPSLRGVERVGDQEGDRRGAEAAPGAEAATGAEAARGAGAGRGTGTGTGEGGEGGGGKGEEGGGGEGRGDEGGGGVMGSRR